MFYQESDYRRVLGQLCVVIFVCLLNFIPFANAESEDDCVKKCKKDCQAEEDMTPFDKRVKQERKIRGEPFVLIPHKPNYLLATWDDTLDEQDKNNEPYETKFQISFKIPVTPAGREWTLFFGYTQLSVWQMSNTSNSSPFRDTNFEPEAMLYYIPTQANFLGMRIRLINFGLFNHQSNGQSGENSRSWNRSYLETVLEAERHYIGLKAWYRWPEHAKTGPNDTQGDDNPNIEEYIGHGEIKYLYAGEENNFGITVRDNFHIDHDRYGSFQVDYSFPISLFMKQGLRVYLQYFNGYGETLIDYNKKRERIGMGVILADWL